VTAVRHHVFCRPRARADLLEIPARIAGDDAAATSRFLAAAEKSFRQLARSSKMGAAGEFTSPHLAGIRRWRVSGFENYLIFYRPRDDGVEIVRVLHGARNIDSIFGDSE
jgi:toxin ParE1/3/4